MADQDDKAEEKETAGIIADVQQLNRGKKRVAYFRSNEPYPEDAYPEDGETEQEYDDGFDELTETEEEIPELSDEEKHERRMSRMRLALGAGNLFGVIAGAVIILIMLTLIFSIIHFVINDMGRNFSLFQTNF